MRKKINQVLPSILMFLFINISFFIIFPKLTYAEQVQVFRIEYLTISCGSNFSHEYDLTGGELGYPSVNRPLFEKVRLHNIPNDVSMKSCHLTLEFRHYAATRLYDPNYPDHNWNFLWYLDNQENVASRYGGRLKIRPYGADIRTIRRKQLENNDIRVRRCIATRGQAMWWCVYIPITKLFPYLAKTSTGITRLPDDIGKDKKSSLKFYARGFEKKLYHGGNIYVTLPGFKIEKPLQLK